MHMFYNTSKLTDDGAIIRALAHNKERRTCTFNTETNQADQWNTNSMQLMTVLICIDPFSESVRIIVADGLITGLKIPNRVV